MPNTLPSTAAPRAGSAAAITARFVLVALLGVAALLTAPSAVAHDSLVEASPGQDAVVDAPPTEVALTFSAEVLDLPTTIVVSAPDGAVVAQGTPTIDAETVRLPLPQALPDGDYEVTWSIVSSDGHRTEESYTFTLAADGETRPPESATNSTSSPAATAAPSTETPEPAGVEDADPATQAPAAAGWMPSGTSILLIQAGIVVFAVAAALAYKRWFRR
ncbi:copper resistance protein CopC [Georgenia muralis]